MTDEEKCVDYNVTADADVNDRDVVQLEFRSNHYFLERVQRIDYQSNREHRQYLEALSANLNNLRSFAE